MRNKNITIFLILLTILILAFVAYDITRGFIEKKPKNPYLYSLEEYSNVASELIKYKESKQIKIKASQPKGINYNNEKIYLITDSFLQVINLDGQQLLKMRLQESPNCVSTISENRILIGFKNYFSILDSTGQLIKSSTIDDSTSVFTSIASYDELIYIADAGKRRVLYYNSDARLIGEFRGESGNKAVHGFVIPSPLFDLDFSVDGALWVVNSGMHKLQNYSSNGKLIDHWGTFSINIEGFSGCCNPAHFTIAPNGNFITSEKGNVRIKEYNPEGELLAVVAAPDKFKQQGRALDLTVDKNGNVIALDFDKKLIRFFVKN